MKIALVSPDGAKEFDLAPRVGSKPNSFSAYSRLVSGAWHTEAAFVRKTIKSFPAHHAIRWDTAGYPDRIFMRPDCPPLLIEFKLESALRYAQQIRLRQLSSDGYAVAVVAPHITVANQAACGALLMYGIALEPREPDAWARKILTSLETKETN